MRKLIMKKQMLMKTIVAKLLLLSLFFTQSSLAVDIDQIRARNALVEQGLMNLRVEQAKAILAGTDPKVSWRNKIVQLNNQINDINFYTTNQQNNNRALAIDASQQLVKELANKYTKKVYGSRQPVADQDDPILANLEKTFKILKRMEKHPEKQVELYAKLQAQMTGLDVLIHAK